MEKKIASKLRDKLGREERSEGWKGKSYNCLKCKFKNVTMLKFSERCKIPL
jgi:hypothetical protein